MLRFEVLQAQHGDCFIMRWTQDGQPRLAVIDGGPKGVYANLQRRLLALKGGAPTLVIDWMMVSHIDDDHITGLLDLMTALRDDHQAPRTSKFRVRQFWFNAFEDLAGVKPAAAQAAQASLAALEAELPGGLSHETQAILATVGQGRSLRDAIDTLGLANNQPVNGLVRSGVGPVDVDGLKVTIVGPLQAQLEALRADWAKPPKKRKARPAELASYEDISVANLSSIVCHVAFKTGAKTRTLLLTGDARGDYILKGLEAAGLLTDGKVELDLLKVQHHGSDRDVVKDFFVRTPAKHYVISANGKYNNPDRATLQWLIEARGAEPYTLHISNELPWMAAFFAQHRPGKAFDVVYRGPLTDNANIDEINLD